MVCKLLLTISLALKEQLVVNMTPPAFEEV